ncbi:MAG: enoyl-CoA hydratase-related protein [Magnetovibrio sp.]|nr:enoyl-CoA hydratase-related protein [Magnetovibrio sp.]
MSDLVLTERDGDIVTVVLNNPEKRNALPMAAWSRLAYTIAPLALDDSVRCIVVRGAGDKAFAAGADISEFPDVRANSEQAAKYGAATAQALDVLVNCPHPTIAMIQGACTGGGLEIACCCDIRMANRSAKFGVPINRIGHPFAYPELEPVMRVAGRAVVLDLLLTGRIIDAEEALRLGLVGQVCDDDALEAEVGGLAESIAAAAPLSNRATKKFVNRLGADPSPLTADEIAESYAACDSEDYAEGVRAFLAKEKPAFQGR